MTAHDVLVKARNLIADPDHWGRGRELGDDPAKHCAGLAIGRVGDGDLAAVAATEAIREAAPCASVPFWNDASTHAEVLAAFDRAIAATAPEPDLSFMREGVVA